MKAYCCLCGADIEIAIDKFLETDQEIDDFYCEECTKAILEFAEDFNLRLN
jgi:hypothetical protein